MVYFLSIGGIKSDALSHLQVRELIERGEVVASTLAWTQGMDGWKPLGEFAEFESVFQPPQGVATAAGGHGVAAEKGTEGLGGKGGSARGRSEKPIDPALRRNPWMRLFARGIDYILFSLVLTLGIALLFPAFDEAVGSSELASQIVPPLTMLLWCFLEAVFLSIWGTTPGKALFSISVRTVDGDLLSYKIALQRSLIVWVKGLALMIYFAMPIAMMLAHARLTIFGVTSWDRDLRLTVSHGKPGQMKSALAIAIYAAFAFLVYLQIRQQLDQQREKEKIEKQERGEGEEEKGESKDSPISPDAFV